MCASVSRGRQANPVLTYITALRRFSFGDGDSNQKAKATAEERLYKTRIIISAVVANASMSRGRQANPVLTYITALRRFLGWRCTVPLMHTDVGRFFCDSNQKAKATAEWRLYNHSPRLACLPGVSRGIIIYRRRAVV